jgi:hypothetical protein
LERQSLGCPLKEDLSVFAIMKELTQNQGQFVEGPCEHAFDKTDSDVLKMVESLKISPSKGTTTIVAPTIGVKRPSIISRQIGIKQSQNSNFQNKRNLMMSGKHQMYGSLTINAIKDELSLNSSKSPHSSRYEFVKTKSTANITLEKNVTDVYEVENDSSLYKSQARSGVKVHPNPE